MKTPEEIKKGLAEAPHVKYVTDDPVRNDVHYERYGVAIGYGLRDNIASYISALELYVSQVSKALCGKESVTICEALDAVSQLKSRLAQVERERDAAVDDARLGTMCDTCKHNNSKDYPNKPCYKCGETFNCWEWRGLPENTKGDADA